MSAPPGITEIATRLSERLLPALYPRLGDRAATVTVEVALMVARGIRLRRFTPVRAANGAVLGQVLLLEDGYVRGVVPRNDRPDREYLDGAVLGPPRISVDDARADVLQIVEQRR
jgi:hypothetical protein